MKKSNVLIGMILINFISMISGFLRDSSIVYSLGATQLSDIFMFIINLPTVLFSAIGWVIMSTFVPLYTDIMIKESQYEANKFANIFIKLMSIFSILVVGILFLFNKISITILAPGFLNSGFEITKNLYFIVIPSLIFLTISSCFSAILNSHKKMLWVSFVGVPMNIMIIIGMLLIYPILGIEFTVFLVVIASIIQILILINPLRNVGFKFTLDFNLKDRNVKRIIKMIGPMVIGVMAQQINVMFGGSITSTLSSGSLTSYNLATKITNAAYNSIILIGISFIFPYLVEKVSKGDLENYIEQIRKSINLILIVLIPIAVLLVVLNESIIKVLYGYGKFNEYGIKLTGNILIYLSVGIIFTGIRELVYRAYYAKNNTKTPMKFSIVGIVLNIIISLILVKYLGVIGVALGNSISIIISCILIYILFKKENEIKYILSKRYILSFMILTIILFCVSIYTRRLVSLYITTDFLIILSTTLIDIIVYIILLYIFKINILEYLTMKKKNNIN